MITEYKINKNTLAIIPFSTSNSVIYENRRKNIVGRRPNKIIFDNCLKNGSSFDGRLDSTRLLTGYTYKAPILIKEQGNIIFFPTSSPRLNSVSWINFNNIDDYFPDKDGKRCIIKFFGGEELKLNVSFFVINQQIYKSTKLYKQILKKDFQFA